MTTPTPPGASPDPVASGTVTPASTGSPSPYGPSVPSRPAGPRRGRIADVTASVILMVAGVIGFGMLAFVTVFLVMMSDGCMGGTCNFDLMTVGWLIALIAPPLVFIVAIVWTLIRIARRKTAWWVTVSAAVVSVGIWIAGVAMMQASLGT